MSAAKLYPRLVYRDDMSPVEADLLLASIASQIAALAPVLGPATETEKEIARELVEQGLDYFNRHIAGDR